MTTALNSKSFKSSPTLEISPTLREFVAAMPIVLFFNAVRTAYSGKKTPALARATAR